MVRDPIDIVANPAGADNAELGRSLDVHRRVMFCHQVIPLDTIDKLALFTVWLRELQRQHGVSDRREARSGRPTYWQEV